MHNKDNKGLSRRSFLKRMGVGASVVGVGLAGCNSKDNVVTGNLTTNSEIPTDKMEYRTNPKTGEKVSLLGYGCMRWPTVKVDDKDEIDQETVNRLVDTAIAHGVNYFDTSPAYCKGRSERATGIALKRHPRESFYVATKLSNFSPSTWSRKASLDMYHNSFKELQVDYI
ncbi:MAG: aldo/keto reductase, partial [Duncaniella sp.]|nr:aldo/keto reductase [Duncaniella sp.]